MRWYTNVKLIGNHIYVRGYENGNHFKDRIEYRPTLYLKTENETEYTTLDNEYVKPIQPGTITETRDFIKKYRDVDGFTIYGNDNSIYQYISDNYPENEIHFDIKKINLVTLDIEVASENGFPDVKKCDEEILLITIQDYATKEIITWGTRPFNKKLDNYKYILCRDERHLLDMFLEYWSNCTPEVITGWNVEFYDIPYIVGRINRVLGSKFSKKLTAWNFIKERQTEIRGQTQTTYELSGISILDYLNLYKKYSFKNPENYRLDTVAYNELGDRKLDHTKYDTFKEFYTKDWDTFVLYNKLDVELVDRIEDKIKLIELALTMAYDAKVNYEDVFFQVRLWDTIIYNYLRKRNIVVPEKEKGIEKVEKYQGAYVKEPIPGVYDWVVSFDLNSLYPHLIMMYNISPETLLEEKHPSINVNKVLSKSLDLTSYKDYAVCANGSMYRKDFRGFLPELMDKMYADRVIFKNKMLESKKKYEKTPSANIEKDIARYNNIQLAKKISLNSAYGAIGNNYFRYYKLENAEAITLSGQVAIRWIEQKMNLYLNKILKTEDVDYVIASDTDSIYLHMDPVVQTIFKGREKTTESIVSFLDKVCKVELEKYIESSYQELAEYLNAYAQKMQMKRENVAERGIWIAKKRYILNVWDSEGVRYSEPKLKMMGIEAIKSSTPAFCRKKIKKTLELIMSSDENSVIKFIEKCRTEFNQLTPEEISFPRTVSDVDKFHSSINIYQKGTPIHSRGALLYNYYIKDRKLTNKYSLIKNGEKIKYCYLKIPNPMRENVITFIQKFPTELDLNKYVDYETQFNKSFIQPLKTILDIIGWEIEKTSTLESFFS
jgi:DNA polymerase elongation subunit (family B)